MDNFEAIQIHKENENKRLINLFLKSISIENNFERTKQVLYICTIYNVKIETYKNEYEFTCIDLEKTVSNFGKFLLERLDVNNAN